jgi:hypothetical protein
VWGIVHSARVTRYLAVVVLLAACGDDSSGTPIDAAVDAPPVLIDAPPPPPGHHHYVIDSLLVPTNNNMARDYGQDLDNDGAIDNQLGMVLGTLSSMGLDVQMLTTQNVDRGNSITLIDMFANDLTAEPAATFATFVGAKPMPTACANASDTTCRHHLAGNATFTITAGAPTNQALTGAIVGGTYTSAPAGHLAGPFAVFPSTTPTTVNLVGARVIAMQPSATKIMTIKIGGAITDAEMDAKVYPAISAGMQADITRDCTAPTNPPSCGCASASAGKNWLDLIDSPPKDCKITAPELKANGLFMSLLAPDVMIDGQRALSIGYKATAVEAGFVAP